MNNSKSKPLVSIVIRAKNEEKGLPKLLNSIKRQKFDENYEIILVDSGSTDNTLQIAKDNSLKIIQIPAESFTYGYALNVGVKYARGDIIIYLSAHTYVLNKDWLKNLVYPFRNKQIQCTFGKLIGMRNINPFEFVQWKIFFPSVNDVFTGLSNFKKLSVSNSNAAYNKKYLLNNSFNEIIPYCEDFLMALHILKDRFSIKYIHNSIVYHTHPYNFKNNFLNHIKIGYASQFINLIFLKKKPNFLTILYNSLKNNFLNNLNFFRIFLIDKNFFGIIKLLSHFISNFAGDLIGKIHFLNQYTILKSLK